MKQNRRRRRPISHSFTHTRDRPEKISTRGRPGDSHTNRRKMNHLMMPTKNFLELGLCDSTWFRTLMQSAASIHEQRQQRVNEKSTQQHRLDEHEMEQKEKKNVCWEFIAYLSLKMKLPSSSTRTTYMHVLKRRCSSIGRRRKKWTEKFNTWKKKHDDEHSAQLEHSEKAIK